MTDPILIPCEGSGAIGHQFGRQMICAMCGAVLWPTLVAPHHERDDILAHIERGDFYTKGATQ